MENEEINGVVAIIPARGGSKGIPRKNIKKLAGKPLIAYTIQAALNSRYVKNTIVSTEDSEIKIISEKYGAEVIDRPNELAKDETPISDVIFNVLDQIQSSCSPKYVLLLQPTSPLRSAEDVDAAVETFSRNDCESLISVYEKNELYWTFKNKNKYIVPVFGKKYFNLRRQELPKVYTPNGSIFISDIENLYKYDGFYSEKILPYVMPKEKSIDIDNELDFLIAEKIIKGK